MDEKDLLKRILKKQYNYFLISSISISIFEIFFMIRGLIYFDFNNWKHITYFSSYIFLLTISLIVMYLLLSRKDKESYVFSILIIYVYAIIIIIWSMVISFIDWIDQNFPIVYLTCLMGVSAITTMKPRIFFAVSIITMVTLIIAVRLYDVIVTKLFLESGLIFDMIVFELTSVFICYKLYNYSIEEFEKTDKLKIMSLTDELTSLGNRRSLDLKIEEEKKYSFALVDIDNFKVINDQYGHDVGDNVLIHLSNILKNHFSDVFRYGGDEIVIISNLSGSCVNKLLLKAKEELKKQATIFPCFISFSYGIYENTNTLDLKEVFKYADEALYTAKRNGKNKGVIYK